MSGRGISGWAARIAQALYDGRRTAIDRMAAECVDLGGHGIVGSALQVREFPGDSFSVAAVEFNVIGTAVRASGCPPLPRPFASDLSGSDFAKLLMVGWVPAGIALDIVSEMTLHVRSDACRAHPGSTDHFADAVITGTAIARFTDQRNTTRPPSLAVLSLEAGD